MTTLQPLVQVFNFLQYEHSHCSKERAMRTVKLHFCYNPKPLSATLSGQEFLPFSYTVAQHTSIIFTHFRGWILSQRHTFLGQVESVTSKTPRSFKSPDEPSSVEYGEASMSLDSMKANIMNIVLVILQPCIKNITRISPGLGAIV